MKILNTRIKLNWNSTRLTPACRKKIGIMLTAWGLLVICLFANTVKIQPRPFRGLQPQCFFQMDRYWARTYLSALKFPLRLTRPDETIWSIARAYYITPESLLQLNQMDQHQLQIGEKLFIPPVNCNQHLLTKYTFAPGETVNGLLRKLGLLEWELQRLNTGVDLKSLSGGAVLYIPGRRVFASRGGERLLYLVKPVSARLTSPYGKRWGRMHWGIDLAAPYGTAVKAAAGGMVVYAGWRGGYGLLVVLQHGHYRTYYGHLSHINTRLGEWLEQGTILGTVGATGRATGSHLHFEVERNKQKINPGRFFY